MKKYLFGAIAWAGIMLMVMSCSTRERKTSTWKPYKAKMITWQKLDTFVFENPTFKVEYPNIFVLDSSLLDNRDMRFDYSFAGCEVFLKCFSYPNDANMLKKVKRGFYNYDRCASGLFLLGRTGWIQ